MNCVVCLKEFGNTAVMVVSLYLRSHRDITIAVQCTQREAPSVCACLEYNCLRKSWTFYSRSRHFGEAGLRNMKYKPPHLTQHQFISRP